MAKLTSQIFLLEIKKKYLIDNQSTAHRWVIIMSYLQQTQYQNFVRSGSIFSVSRFFCIVIIDSVSFWVDSAKAIAVPTSKWIKFQMKSGKYRAKGKNSAHTTNDRIVFQQILYFLVQAFKFWVGCRIQHCSTFRCHLFIYFMRDFSEHI